MKTVWEKKPGRWKVSGETKVFATKEAALEYAATFFDVIAEFDNNPEIEVEESVIEDIDPLEALRLARSNNGSIEEGSDNGSDIEEQGLSESPDRGLFGSTWD